MYNTNKIVLLAVADINDTWKFSDQFIFPEKLNLVISESFKDSIVIDDDNLDINSFFNKICDYRYKEIVIINNKSLIKDLFLFDLFDEIVLYINNGIWFPPIYFRIEDCVKARENLPLSDNNIWRFKALTDQEDEIGWNKIIFQIRERYKVRDFSPKL